MTKVRDASHLFLGPSSLFSLVHTMSEPKPMPKPIAGSAVASSESINVRPSRMDNFRKWRSLQENRLSEKYRLMLKHPGPCIVLAGGLLFIVSAPRAPPLPGFAQISRALCTQSYKATAAACSLTRRLGQLLVTAVVLMGALQPRCFSAVLPWYVHAQDFRGV